MIAFKKIFGILLVLASGFASGAAQDGNVREGKRRIVANGDGVPVALPVPAALPVAIAGKVEPDKTAFTEEDLALDPAEFAFLKEVKIRLAQNEASRKWRKANPERMRAAYKAWYEANKDHKRAINKAYRKANPERRRATKKAYREKRKAKKQAAAQKKAQM